MIQQTFFCRPVNPVFTYLQILNNILWLKNFFMHQKHRRKREEKRIIQQNQKNFAFVCKKSPIIVKISNPVSNVEEMFKDTPCIWTVRAFHRSIVIFFIKKRRKMYYQQTGNNGRESRRRPIMIPACLLSVQFIAGESIFHIC